jgi:hypothetical protein
MQNIAELFRDIGEQLNKNKQLQKPRKQKEKLKTKPREII